MLPKFLGCLFLPYTLYIAISPLLSRLFNLLHGCLPLTLHKHIPFPTSRSECPLRPARMCALEASWRFPIVLFTSPSVLDSASSSPLWFTPNLSPYLCTTLLVLRFPPSAWYASSTPSPRFLKLRSNFATYAPHRYALPDLRASWWTLLQACLPINVMRHNQMARQTCPVKRSSRPQPTVLPPPSRSRHFTVT